MTGRSSLVRLVAFSIPFAVYAIYRISRRKRTYEGAVVSFPDFILETIEYACCKLEHEEELALRDLVLAYLRQDSAEFESLLQTQRRQTSARNCANTLENLFCIYTRRYWRRIENIVSINLSVVAKSEDEHVNKKTRSKKWQRASELALSHAVSKKLHTLRSFMTMVHVLHEIQNKDKFHEKKVLNNRPPVVIFLGGGMAAGKSSLRSTLLKAYEAQAVIIEADAIKQHDVVYQTLQKSSIAFNRASVEAHNYSTKAAESMLVAAVNEGKDILMDGTFTWRPFVEQTIAMIREAHKYAYKLGPGFTINRQGEQTEIYFEQAGQHEQSRQRLPYKIELYAVTTDPVLAVSRGILRALETKRTVPLIPQLRSHSLFARGFPHYAALVDRAYLFHTGDYLNFFCKDVEELQLCAIAHRDTSLSEKLLVDYERYKSFEQQKWMNVKAESPFELFGNSWINSIVERLNDARNTQGSAKELYNSIFMK